MNTSRKALLGALDLVGLAITKRIAKLIPALNITGDPVLDKVRKEIMASIGTVRANDLRDDVFTREEMAKKAQGILDIMAPAHREAA